MKNDNRGIVVLCLLLASALFALAQGHLRNSAIISALFGNWDFVKSVQRETGTFYRLKVNLTYKGKPQDFDIVVTCGGRETDYRDGGRTVEIGVTPSAFGRRMDDGKGIVVHPPRACRGETTENGEVPPDLMPIVVVYDDADTLAFGNAYLSDDAYESPRSVLQFGGATIERSDRAAFEQFRRDRPNLITRSSYWTSSGVGGLKLVGLPAAHIPMGVGCYGYARFRLTNSEKERAHELWPAARPRFWEPATREDQEAIDPIIYNRLVLTDHDEARPSPWNLVVSQLDYEVANIGMPRRHPASWGKNPRPTAPSYYPDIGAWMSLPWPADAAARGEAILRDGPHVGASIDFRNGAMRGFAYCRPTPQNFPTGVGYPDPTKAPDISWLRLPQINFIDGIEVAGRSNNGSNGPPLIVERDEFIFRPFHFGLSSLWGDV
jgi:hypothetical protein